MRWLKNVMFGGGESTVTVNGMTIKVKGGRVYINGTRYIPANGPDELGPPPVPETHQDENLASGEERRYGPVSGDLTVRGNYVTVTIEGDVDGNVRADGSVTCGAVDGYVNAGGSVRAGDVDGNVSAGGSVTCGDVDGSISAGGSVKSVRR